MSGFVLEFEKPIVEIERRIAELKEYSAGEDIELQSELERLEKKAQKLQ